MTSDIRDRMGGFKLTRGSLVIAVERWLKDLAVDYAKMDEASRHKEAEIYVGEFLTALSPCAREGEEPLAKGYVSQQSMQEYEEMRWTLSVYPRHSKHANIRVLVFAVPGGKP